MLVIVLINVSNIFSRNKEAVSDTASSFVYQKDSLSKNYKDVKYFYDNKDYKKSLQKALIILENKNKVSKIEYLLTTNLVANIFYLNRNDKNAIKYFKKNIKLLQNFKELDNFKPQFIFSEDIALIYSESLLNLGNLYYRLYNAAGVNNKRDSILYYYQKVNNLPYASPSILEVKSRAYSNTSVMYMNEGKYKEAESYALKSIKIHKNLNNKVNEAAALGNLSSIYLSQDNYNEAKKTYIEALDLIRNIKTDKALLVREKLYFNLAYNLYKLKDYEAYTYQELSYNIKDSLREKELKAIIAEVNERHNFDVKKNLLLKQEENKRLKAQRTFWIIGIGGLIVILSLLYGVNFYKLKQKNLGLELSQTQLIQSQKIEKIRSDSQVRILNATIDGKESERKQIAETLHDSVSALLSSANLHLQATKGKFNGKTPVEIDKTREIITEASQKIRDLSHTLVSSVLLKFGLKFAIKDMADKYSNSQIEINTNFGEVKRYQQSFEIKIYNIIQEFVNNILKHSKASLANIDLEEKDGKLFLTITDNGIGFDKTQITQKDGLGINQIDARIKVMKGVFHIDSSKNNGTKIKVELPVVEKEQPNLV